MAQVTQVEVVIDEELFPWQADYMGIGPAGRILTLPNFNFAKCGTKAGKTAGSALGMFTRMLNLPGTRWCWTAPVNKQLEPTWQRYFKPLIHSLPKHMVKIRDAYGMWQVEVKDTQSMIALKSGDEPWSLRSDAFHGAVIDEAAHYPLESYFSIMTNLSENAGILWAISTPKAQIMKAGQSWFDSGFIEGLRQRTAFEKGDLALEDMTHKALRVPTWANPKPEIQKWIKIVKTMAENGTLPGGLLHFRREYGAEDVEGDSAVFRHIVKLHTEHPRAAEPGKTYAMGWDPAGRGGDASVISIWDTTTRCEVHIEYMLRVSFEQQMERLKHLWEQYGRPMGCVDATSWGGDLLIEQIRKREMGFTAVKFNQYSKAQYVQQLALAMEREEPHFLNNPIARGEMEAFGFEVLPSGSVRYTAPPGQRDDTVTARMLAWGQIVAGMIQVF